MAVSLARFNSEICYISTVVLIIFLKQKKDHPRASSVKTVHGSQTSPHQIRKQHVSDICLILIFSML